jgi:beta-lactamase regulating signal transducer with metallopeptidase domain
MNWFASPHWAVVVEALLHTVWEGALVTVMVCLALRGTTAPVKRYRLLLGALAGVVAAGVLTWALLDNEGMVPRPTSIARGDEAVVATPPSPKPAAHASDSFRSEPVADHAPWTAWLALAWLAGAAAMLARCGARVAAADRLRRSARPVQDTRVENLLAEARRAVGLARRAQVAATDKLTSPVVVGALFPTIILPLSLLTTFTPEQIRFVLLHELAHARRGDYFANLFQLISEALLFFNPAVWWISRQIRVEREACCDQLAVELSGAPADYARTLVRVAESALISPPLAALAFGEKRGASSLADRLRRLLVPGYRPDSRLTWRTLLAGLLGGGGLLFLSALGARVTVAAIVSPEERIARIEKKMKENAEPPEGKEDFHAVGISAALRVKDGAALPKNSVAIWSVFHRGTAVYDSLVREDGTTTNNVHPGQIWIEADVDGYAPLVAGPFNGWGTNSIDAGQIVVDRGFQADLRVTDAATGAAVTNGSIRARFVSRDSGVYLKRQYDAVCDATGRVAFPLCLDQPFLVTVNAPGYELVDRRFERLKPGQELALRLRQGAVIAGSVIDRESGRGIAGATVRVLFESGQSDGHYEWNDSSRILATTDASGHFAANQFAPGSMYYLGVSAPGHESVIVPDVLPGGKDLVAKLGPELVVRGRVLGGLGGLERRGSGYVINRSYQAVFVSQKEGNSRYVFPESDWAPVRVANGIATFQFTNRVRAQVSLQAGGFHQERDVFAPIDDWELNLADLAGAAIKPAPRVAKREVIFRFKSASGVPPRGTVSVMIPDNLEKNHLTAHNLEVEIKEGEVRAEIAVGGRTSIEPKRMPGYWFDRAGRRGALLSIEVTNGPGPMMVEIPLVPAGAIYATARNADGSPASGLFFGASELRPAPGREKGAMLDGGGDGFSSEAPRKWISGPLPLGGTYQVYGYRGNSFCLGKPVELTEENPDAEIELQFLPGKTLDGVLLGPDGGPVRDGEVKLLFTLSDEHGFSLKSVLTDERGRFRLENATPEAGVYTAEAEIPGLMAENVKLESRSQPQVIRLQRGRKLAGRVVESGTGFAIPGAEIRAFAPTQPKLPSLSTRADSDGRFEFASLGDASYSLYVSGARVLPENNYRADGSTNLALAVKLYEWSKLKPSGPPEAAR